MPEPASGGRPSGRLHPACGLVGAMAETTREIEAQHVMNARESETFEVKSQFGGTTEDWATLIKTVVAMANTSGGRIVLERIECKLADLDSARIDDKVNKYVSPRVRGITACAMEGGYIDVGVNDSESKPHVFRCDLAVPDKPGKAYFYPGQLWVRHGSKNEPATAEDVERILRQRVARVLDELRVRVLQSDSPLSLTTGDGIPVRFSDEPGAVAVVPDIDRHYPYTARTLGGAVGKGQNWGAAAARYLELKGKPEFWIGTRGSKGYAVQRYSERALALVRAQLEADPTWNPFAALLAKGRRTKSIKAQDE